MMSHIPAVLFAFLFAIGFSQVPAFLQEYQQRLGGAVDELRSVVEEDRASARRNGVTLQRLIEDHRQSARPTVRATGVAIGARVERLAVLEKAADRLAAASALERPWVFLRTVDRPIAQGTWTEFKPTLTLDIPYGAAGVLAGLLVNGLLGWALSGWRRSAY
jgi:hypothetical protein